MSVLGIFTFANSDIDQKKRLKNIILLDMNEAMAVSSKLSVTLVLIKRLKNIILLDMNEAMAVSSKLSVTLVLIKILVISD